MGARRTIGVAAVIMLLAVGSHFGFGRRPMSEAREDQSPIIVVSEDLPRAANRVQPEVFLSSIPVNEGPTGRPLPSRGARQVMARRDMALVTALVAKGPPEQRILGDAMMTQDRDVATAAPDEAAMQLAFGGVPALVGVNGLARVTCVSTTCEVSGVAAPGQSVAAVEQALRDPALLNSMVSRGYMPGPVTVGSIDGATRFVMYLNNEM